MDIKKDFGLRIKELRNKMGITQYQLADIVNIDPKHMSHIETGRSFPKADLIEKLSAALCVDYTALFETKHFEDRNTLQKKISEILETASDGEIRLIYKIVSECIKPYKMQ